MSIESGSIHSRGWKKKLDNIRKEQTEHVFAFRGCLVQEERYVFPVVNLGYNDKSHKKDLLMELQSETLRRILEMFQNQFRVRTLK